MKLLVVGAAGQLGTEVVRQARADGHEVTAATRRELDLTDHAAVLRAVAAERPDAIVNAAAYNDVERAEDDVVAALEVNAFGVRSLARAATRARATLVHYSTDFVFDGETDRPYVETDEPRPLSAYACSKLLGEWFALDAPGAFVLRVESLFGGAAARSSLDRILEALEAGREARVFVDRVVSPSYVEDVARATLALLTRKGAPGLYHCVNTGAATWEALARELARQAGIEPRLVPVRTDEVALRAKRPRYCALSNEKLRQAGIDMPAWQDATARYLAARRAHPRP